MVEGSIKDMENMKEEQSVPDSKAIKKKLDTENALARFTTYHNMSTVTPCCVYLFIYLFY